ncbi:MAG: (2Fe-2S)-binding protein [Methylococcales bacterium]
MYICICNCVTESQIRDCVENQGVRRVNQLRKQLGTCTRCGKCALATKQTLDRYLLEQQNFNKTLDLETPGSFYYG